MASMDEAGKDTGLNCAPNPSNDPTTRSETERLSHDKSIQTSAPASPENMRTLEEEQGVLTQQDRTVEDSAINPVVGSKDTEPQPSQQSPSSSEQQQQQQQEQPQQSQQPLQQEQRGESETETKPETKPEAAGDVDPASPENACQSSIGAAVDGQPSSSAYQSQVAPISDNDGPTLLLNILLTSGGKHPFKLDGKYLRKREVNVTDNDPFNMTVYTLKELIWREWRSDWISRPSSPAAIRLISFGKMLDDKAPLSDCRFNREGPNVVHMTVKPQVIIDEEDSKATKSTQSRDHEESERSPGCRCVIL
ncbi:uncharacterized protein GIQ15_02382 [Arthroderma uncinatum]|uniref:uncharacterized protein n=1 Tax=Arthroderma uncinatum TaxID=74035 RepID=UPI00144A8346|nr:uncharacterized protein GIQ15_02382 [Arthroderma uncinatum]KAF3483058.1 hypothetical protein GIQ15_02382 [Arthroderma uncinatum]